MMRGEGEVWHWRIFNFFFLGGMWRRRRERMEKNNRELKLGSIGECWF